MPELYSTAEVSWLVRDARNLPEAIEAKERAVLYALATRVNPPRDQQYVCYPSLEEIAGDTSQSVRNVQRALKNLEDADLIVRQQRTNTSSLIWINVAKLLTFQPSGERLELPPSPIPVPTKDGTTVADRPAAKEPEPSPESPVAVAIKKLKHIGEKISQRDAGRLAAALMKKHSEEELLKVIGGFDDHQLALATGKAQNHAGYLKKMIVNALVATGGGGDGRVDERDPDSVANIRQGSLDDWIKEALDEALSGAGSIGMAEATDEQAVALIQRMRQLAGDNFFVSDLQRDANGPLIRITVRQTDDITTDPDEPEDEPGYDDLADSYDEA